jgi:hypothetical protein
MRALYIILPILCVLAISYRYYSAFIADVGFAPERGNRYIYRLSAGCANPQVRGGAAIANASPGTIDCVQVDLGRYPGAVANPPTAGGVPAGSPRANPSARQLSPLPASKLPGLHFSASAPTC